MGVSSTQVGDHWGSARTVQPITFLGESGDSGAKYCGVLGRICGVVVVLTTTTTATDSPLHSVPGV